MTIPTNLFGDLPQQLHAELVQTLLEAANVRIERIVSQGHASPAGFWYDQDQHEWVVVLKGAARLRFEDKEQQVEDEARRLHQYPGTQTAPGRMDYAGRADDLAGGALWRSAVSSPCEGRDEWVRWDKKKGWFQ